MKGRFFPAVFSVAALSGSLLLAGCGAVSKGLEQASEATQHVGTIGRYGKLTQKETLWAKVAWRYFQNNTNADIGLVNGSDKQPTFTVWQAGDYLAATVAARELGLIEEQEFDTRVSYLLGFLSSMDLSDDKLPNKAYNAITGKMVNFGNQPDNIGWSAVDIGRLLMWMKITGQRHPKFQEYLDKVALRWNYCDVIDNCGQLFGRYRNKKESSKYQEGRLGYEQLAGAGFAVWGFNSWLSGNVPAVETTTILGLPLQYDARDARATGVQAPVLTMPHVFMGMELGWRNPAADRYGQRTDTPSFQELANQVYRVQEARYLKERVYTARSDYQVRSEPYQVFNSVFAAGYPWNTIGSDGKEYEKLSLVSTRAAFGMWVLWPTPYTDQLIEVVQSMYDKERGWFEGRLEASGAPQQNITLATNAAVLEALLFKVKGRLYTPEPAPGYFQVQLADVFLKLNRCYPSERPVCEVKPAQGRPDITPLLTK
jgi:hypothetical protein